MFGAPNNSRLLNHLPKSRPVARFGIHAAAQFVTYKFVCIQLYIVHAGLFQTLR